MTTSSLISLLGLLAILSAVIYRVAFWPAVRSRRIRSQDFPQHWLGIVQSTMPFYSNMSTDLQQQLQNLIKEFLAGKGFVGCAGQKITEEIRVTIASQACLLLLNRKTNHYSSLRSILVYPSSFLVAHSDVDEIGLVSTNHRELLGESWAQGKVVLAWDEVERSAGNFRDGQNVVLHEFAHQLDSESSADNGAPVLATRGAYKSWAAVMSREFELLQQRSNQGQGSLLDEYGATNPAEFFAVATETFFECPRQMREGHSELYQELVRFYGVDPSHWLEP